MYYVLGRLYAAHPARFCDTDRNDAQGVWWDDGQVFTKPIRTPLELRLEPYDPINPDMSPAMASLYDGRVPLYSDALLAALKVAGVDNLDTYEARIFDPDTGTWHTDYKAVNVIGMVSAADMAKSVATVHDGIPLVDVSFDRLVIDPRKAHGFLMFRLAENNSAVIVHEQVKQAVLAAGIRDLEFFRPENIAL
ncbi:hypothetical protein D7V97_36825 [Corallococcus sp. CA053C]|uniref:imm11 family protein n=1 Tax=Corallococcus sp. CA053C TaxID=2316732 RepID=UPI000EA0129E|nr:DUF1629 domain-containing protein [Corallococcus sp. CA053C]RKG95667.1 hypothetical protein D7V97_36825 [Corallococcus sp. CA053C]